MNYHFKAGIDNIEFDEFVEKHQLGNMMQTSKWGELKKEWKHELCGLYKDGELVGSALVLFRPLPLGLSFAYIPRGPLMDYTDLEQVTCFFTHLKDVAKKHKAIFIKLDPQITIRETRKGEEDYVLPEVDLILNNLTQSGLKHMGFTTDLNSTTQPRYMAAVKRDVLEDIPKDTGKKLRRAYKNDVKGVICDISRIDDFVKIISYTEKRQGVSLRNHDYFYRMMETFGEDAFLLLCEVNLRNLLETDKKEYEALQAEKDATPEHAKKKLKQLEVKLENSQRDLSMHQQLHQKYGDIATIAGQLALKSNKMMEMLYSGLNEDFAKFYPNYLSYMETFEYAFSNGCEYSNMGGIPLNESNGLTKFKFNFNPYVLEYIGEFDLVLHSFLYKVIARMMKIRKQAMVKKEKK